MKPTVKVEKITPEIARQMLGNNPNNRNISRKHVESIARDIKSGNWQVNGDAIRLNGSNLIDGQHRLSAIILAGMPVETVVARGLDAAVMKTIDTGKRRSLGCVLKMEGEMNVNLLAGALKVVRNYYNGTLYPVTMTNSEGVDAMAKYAGISDSVKFVSPFQTVINKSPLAAIHYIGKQIDHDLADAFCVDIAKGVGMEDNDPVYVLREKMMRTRFKRLSMTPRDQMALCIHVWNLRRSNKKAKMLKMPTSYEGLSMS